jgi:catechol-2,3-dioxygenase
MQTLGFAHYNLRASRDLLDTLRSFYAEIVGLSVGQRPPFKSFGYWLYAGGHDVLHLSEAGDGEVRSVGLTTTFDHVAFKCVGRSEFQQRLDRAGIEVRVSRVPLTGQHQLFFKDPAGNGVELNFASDDD